MTDKLVLRRARLVVVSTRHTPMELEQRLGIEPDAVTRAVEPGELSRRLHRDENTWELHEDGSADTDITDLLESLHARALPVTRTLRALKDEGCTVVINLVLRLSSGDAGGAGFAITRPLIEWLDEAGIEFVDVDQYIFEQ